MVNTKDIPPYDRTLLYGVDEIAAYMRLKPTTVRRYIRKQSLPAGKMPRGQWFTSTALIDVWCLSRDPRQHQLRPGVDSNADSSTT